MTRTMILVVNFHDTQKICYTHKKFKTSINCNQKALLKPYIDLNTVLRKTKNNFEVLLKWRNYSVFKKTMENLRKDRDVKFVTTESKGIILYQNQPVIQL